MLKHQKLIEKLTLEEKVALLNSVSKNATEKHKRTSIPSALFAGKECGVIAPETEDGVAPTTCFPEPETLARSWDIKLANKVAYCMGNEAAALGVSVLRAPDASVIIDAQGDKNYKGLSEDPYLAGKLTA
ncbi:MAG: glycosyl hydrolase, partial [Clostridia bacterium]|nr:glycosyl hydrolase [Clostridia bacterium]